MTQEIALRTPSASATSLQTWAEEAVAAGRLATSLVSTAFVPQAFRGKPAEAAAAILAGAEVGLSPLASLRSFDIIQGTAAPRALTLRAIAQAHGAEFVTVEESPSRVIMKARRNGSEWESVEWTIERAAQMGLTGKDNWKKQPQAMLVARATSDLARRVAADAILGVGYSSEEVQDSPELQSIPAVTSSAELVAMASAEPSPQAVVVEAFGAEVMVEQAAPAQIDTIRALVNELGLTPPAAKNEIQKATGRKDASTANLTWDEAEAVIARLREALNPAPEPEGLFEGDGMTAEQARAFVAQQAGGE